jgi:serine/threonine protein kinase
MKCLRCNVYENKKKDKEKNNINIDPIEKLNKYSKFKNIGKGATSKIYLSKKDNKSYICKCVSRDSLKKGFREIKILKKLNNDCFPRLHEFLSFDNNLFIFMYYENSVDVHKYCFEQYRNNIPIKLIINIIKQMGTAIKTLHSYDFVHLDLKLENFIITEKKIIKLIDFGTVRPICDTEKKLCSIVGTKNYSSPEIYRHKYHKNSDIWSYAVCIWILIIKDYCFNHNKIKKSYNLENFPFELFSFPNEIHLLYLKNYHVKFKELFQQVFKIFPIDRPELDILIDFDYQKYLIHDK